MILDFATSYDLVIKHMFRKDGIALITCKNRLNFTLIDYFLTRRVD